MWQTSHEMKRSQQRKAFKSNYWLQHHLECAKRSITRILARPFSFIITTSMIAIAFTIPAALYILYHSVRSVTDSFENQKQITLFLYQEASLDRANQLRMQLQQWQQLDNIDVINKKDALEKFKQETSLGSIVDSLQSNPLS